MDQPYEERRAALLELGLTGPTWQTPAHHVGDGARLLEASKAQGLEGIIAKRLDCAYTPGRRSNGWVKVKNIRRTDVVIGGWLPGEGGRSGRLGALQIGGLSSTIIFCKARFSANSIEDNAVCCRASSSES